MNSFPNTEIDIMGGIKKFSFAPMSQIESIPGVSVVFKSGYNWFDGISDYRDANLEIEPKSSDNGIMYDSVFNGSYPGNSVSITDLMDEMQNHRFAVLLVDNDGLVYLLLDTKFTAKFVTDVPTGNKKWSYSFRVQSRTRPAVV